VIAAVAALKLWLVSEFVGSAAKAVLMVISVSHMVYAASHSGYVLTFFSTWY
jgi:hypothetical protein